LTSRKFTYDRSEFAVDDTSDRSRLREIEDNYFSADQTDHVSDRQLMEYTIENLLGQNPQRLFNPFQLLDRPGRSGIQKLLRSVELLMPPPATAEE
jgi:hypothetical protein